MFSTLQNEGKRAIYFESSAVKNMKLYMKSLSKIVFEIDV